MATATRDRVRRVIELACRAPSVHNTQPWLWRIVDDSTIELYADRSRQLHVSDPDGRNLAISCGAALHQAIEAGVATGMRSNVEVFPEPLKADLLVRVRFIAARPPPDAAARLVTLDQRCTDRRRFTSWPVPDARLHKLAEAASGWGAFAIPIIDVTARFRAELLMERAMMLQVQDSRFATEQTTWVEHSRVDGVPSVRATPPASGRRAARPTRFDDATATLDSSRVMESSDGLIAICTAEDDQHSWLQAGETLSALWLQATQAGLSVVPLSQAIEIPETRRALHHDVFAGMARPQLLLRVGWQEISRTTLPRSPRRPLDDVLVP